MSKHVKKHDYLKKLRLFLMIFAFVFAMPLTVIVLQQKQIIQQSAQEYRFPPMFGCLTMGESSNRSCATKLADARLNFDLHAKKLTENQTVYYGDVIFGAVSVNNTGDLPINLKSLGAQGLSAKYTVNFNPQQGPTVLLPSNNVSLDTIYHRFDFPDPPGEYTLQASVKNDDDQDIGDLGKTKIKVVDACTALRAKILSDADRQNLLNYCNNNPDKKLCASRQYCEIFTDGPCPQPLSSPTGVLECNETVILPIEEQQLLEEYCSDNMNTDLCSDFCDRTLGSPLCPEKFILADTSATQRSTPAHFASSELRMSIQKHAFGVQTAHAQAGRVFNDDGVRCAVGSCLRPSPNGTGKMLCSKDCGAAPAPARPAPPANPSGGKCENAVGRCNSGCANLRGQCCASNAPLVNNCCAPDGCTTTPGSGAAPAPQPVIRKVVTTRSNCQTKNRLGQCCKHNGPLRPTGQCPLGPGAVGAAPAPNTPPARPAPVRAAPPAANPPAACKPANGLCTDGGGECCPGLVCNLNTPRFGRCGQPPSQPNPNSQACRDCDTFWNAEARRCPAAQGPAKTSCIERTRTGVNDCKVRNNCR